MTDQVKKTPYRDERMTSVNTTQGSTYGYLFVYLEVCLEILERTGEQTYTIILNIYDYHKQK